MAGELAPKQSQAVSTTVSLSSPLALAVKGTPVYGEHGFDGESAAWTMPSRITEAMIAEAKRVLPQAEAMLAMTSREGMLKWVANLGLRCRSTPDAEAAKAQTLSYVQGLETAKVPGISFTQNTLERAASEFKFFPAYSELKDFLLQQAVKEIRTARRLKMIAEAEPTLKDEGKGKFWKDMTEQERAVFDTKIGAVLNRMSRT